MGEVVAALAEVAQQVGPPPGTFTRSYPSTAAAGTGAGTATTTPSTYTAAATAAAAAASNGGRLGGQPTAIPMTAGAAAMPVAGRARVGSATVSASVLSSSVDSSVVAHPRGNPLSPRHPANTAAAAAAAAMVARRTPQRPVPGRGGDPAMAAVVSAPSSPNFGGINDDDPLLLP